MYLIIVKRSVNDLSTKEMKEVYWLRIIACFSVVLIHAISRVLTDFSLTGDDRVVYRTVQMTLMYGTPMFVLISTMIVTHAYKEKIPNGFLRKRLKYILIPYSIMSIFYAADKYYRFEWTISDFIREVGFNLIGQWHGYFVLIIFQFYLLHLLFVKYIQRYNPIHVLTISFFISVGYWLGFYFYLIDFVNHSSYLTLFFSRILLIGWLFYYVVAFYCGRNYERFLEKLKSRWLLVALGTIVSLGLVQYIYHTGILMRVSSARFDLIPYTVLLFFLLIFFFTKINWSPNLVNTISGYSFGIYLLHPFFQTKVRQIILLAELTQFQYLVVQFFTGVVVPIVVIYFFSKLPYGEFIVGKIHTGRKNDKHVHPPKAA